MKELSKNEIRKKTLLLRSTVGEEERETFGLAAKERFLALPAFRRAQSVMLYMDFRGEAPTHPLIEAVAETGKTLVLPFTDRNFVIHPYAIPFKTASPSRSEAETERSSRAQAVLDADFLTLSHLGIWEPNPQKAQPFDPACIHLVIVPGVAFDKEGNRIGYGKGCYDKFLPRLCPSTVKLAYAYNIQILETIPHDGNDVKLEGFV